MMDKQILPETFDFGVPSVDIVECGRKGLDKTAMVKRASAFDDIIGDIKPRPNRTYLHVITTGAQEYYGSNRNGDDFPETNQHVVFPHPENEKRASYDTDGGLKKYHDKTYMDKAAVYQEHHTKDTDPSGEIIAAKYNDDMHRGELLIAVDTNKWHDRLEKKASGQDIFLSMGCKVEKDVCRACGRIAKTASEHCDHFKKMRCEVLEDGTQCSVINDAPHFYDISGVDVPADRIAFVLRKVASGEQVKEASLEAVTVKGVRRPMLLTKSAQILSKLSKLEKQVEGFIEGDKQDDDDTFSDDEDAQKDFTLRVRNFPADEVIDSSSRKGILLSPGMLFKILGKEIGGDVGEALCECDDDSCGDCSAMMREMEDDDETRNNSLLDGSFDQHFTPDLSLENILEDFMPEFSMRDPEVKRRSIHIVIIGGRPRSQKKEASLTQTPMAQEALRRTYARYFISFAAQNNDATCLNALRKIASYGKCRA